LKCSGFIVAVSVIGRNLGAGIILFISAGSWVFLCFFLLWQIKSVNIISFIYSYSSTYFPSKKKTKAIQYYRKGGHTLKGDSKQVAKDLASTETGQVIFIPFIHCSTFPSLSLNLRIFIYLFIYFLKFRQSLKRLEKLLFKKQQDLNEMGN